MATGPALPPAVGALARGLLRRRRWASVSLAVFTGLAAAVPMVVWAAARETATTVDRSLEQAEAADAMVTVCPPGFDPASSDPVVCLEYQPDQEVTASISSLPKVAQAARGGFHWLQVGPTPDPRSWRSRAMVSMIDTVGFPTVLGEPEVIAGRLAADDASDEVMLNEATARELSVGPGDRLWMSGAVNPSGGPPVQSTLVGIVRTAADLLPLEASSLGVPPLHARAGWVRAHAEALPADQIPIFVWLDDGDVGAFETRLQTRLGDQAVAVSSVLDEGERSNLEQATAFESGAALALAVSAGVAVAFFLSQAVSRQARAESSDVPVLLGLGMTRRQLVAAAVVRWIPIALAGAAVATSATLAASALGPIGLARRGPWEPGVRTDWVVLLTGAVAVVVLVLLCGAVSLARRREREDGSAGSITPVPVASPGVRAGVALARRSLRPGGALPVVSALVGTAVAVAAVITAAGGAASLRRVTGSSERFGAQWDALVGGAPVPEQQDQMLTALRQVPGMAAAAAIPGNTVAVGDRELWIQAMVPIEGIERVRPVITAGREPTADNEIALGSTTMRQLDVEVGEEVALQSQVLGTEPRPYRVVGVTMVTDGYEPNVGKGGLVSLGGLEVIAPESDLEADVDVVARVMSGAGRPAALAALKEAFPHAIVPFPLPSSLANAERIAGLPVLLGVAGAAIAAITLTHALIVTVRRNRRELAVYRVLGFTRAQVYGAVATQATLIGSAAAAAGVLLGVVGARWGWRALADSFGVASGAIVPVGVALVSVVAVLLVANLAAAASGRRSTHLRTAEVLRAE